MSVGVGKRILVIDDCVDVRELLSRLLGAYGFNVTGTATGAEGIAAALKSPPDLIILDLSLPDDDGLSVARAILADGGLTHIPVMAVSAFDAMQIRAEAIEAGCVGYAAKPFDANRFVETVRLLTEA